MLDFDNVANAEKFVREVIHGSNLSALSDHRFAVVYGQHFDLTEYECHDTGHGDYFAVVTRYDANECCNMSNASIEHMKKVDAIAVFTELTDAIEFFTNEIHAILIEPRSM